MVLLVGKRTRFLLLVGTAAQEICAVHEALESRTGLDKAAVAKRTIATTLRENIVVYV